jgi:hypothetical protein
MPQPDSNERPEKEAERLRDAVIKRMLNTPPKPHPKPKPGRRPGRPVAS